MEQVKLTKRLIIEKFLSAGQSTHTKALKEKDNVSTQVELNDDVPALIVAMLEENKKLSTPDLFDVVVELVPARDKPTKAKFSYTLTENKEDLEASLQNFREVFNVGQKPTVA